MADIVLTEVKIGMGNPNHNHFHRHNVMHLETQNIDRMVYEAAVGGLQESTLNTIAGESGRLTVQPRGEVSIEDTYNMRRGLCSLRFSVMQNALSELELVVLGYLAGGEPRDDGIDPGTLFIPVRSWTVNSSNMADLSGMPGIKQAVQSSVQFLMGDPNQEKKLRSMRPMDIGNEVLGYISTEQENMQDGYVGNVAADLSKNILVSKTQNLDTTHHAKQLLKIAGNVMCDNDHGIQVQDSVAGSIYTNAMSETLVSENEFFKAMSIATGTWSWSGFQGFTLGEIASVFQNFANCMDLTLMDPNLFPEVDNVALTSAYGATNLVETTAQEVAFLCVDLLIRCGLTHVVFAASNNSNEFNGFMSEDGVEMVTGEWMSIVNSDPHSINRLERFKQLFKDKFYTKFNTGYVHANTIVNVSVTSSLFGETSVLVFFNGDASNQQRYTNATYYIARTSPNIASSEAGVADSVNFLNNLREYFITN